MGILGPLNEAVHGSLVLQTLNKDIVLLVNGTYTNTSISTLDKSAPDWLAEFNALGVRIENRTISSITRLQDSNQVDAPGADTEHDNFLVTFSDGATLQRSAFLVNFPSVQSSDLGKNLGVNITSNKMVVDMSKGMVTNIKGVYAVGDANNDGSTNVPHAMWSGKRAAVQVHGERSYIRSVHYVLI